MLPLPHASSVKCGASAVRMKTTITLSKRNILGLWIIFSLLFIYWLVLLSTSDIELKYLIPSLILLAICLFALPVIGTFCLYVTIDERNLTIPAALIFRRTIPIQSIVALHLKPHAMGLMRGVQIDYVSDSEKSKTARLPAFTTFGRRKTAEMIHSLKEFNPQLKIDPSINKLLQGNGELGTDSTTMSTASKTRSRINASAGTNTTSPPPTNFQDAAIARPSPTDAALRADSRHSRAGSPPENTSVSAAALPDFCPGSQYLSTRLHFS